MKHIPLPKTKFFGVSKTINEFFDKVVLINLDRRPDRLASATAECEKIGLKFERVAAVDGNTLPEKPNFTRAVSALNMTVAQIMRRAISENWQSLLIIEDDIEFVAGANTIFYEQIRHVPTDWSMLYLGAFYAIGRTTGESLQEPIKGNIVRVRKASGGHCFGFHHSLYLEMAEMLERPGTVSDRCDHFHTRQRSYGFMPPIAYQKEGVFSDITMKDTYRNSGNGRTVYECHGPVWF